MTLLLLAVGLIAYNNLANRIRAFHGWAYVPLNLLLGAATVAVAVLGPAGLGAGDVGLDRSFAGGVPAGAALGLIVAGAGLLALRSPSGRRLLADPRWVRPATSREVAYLVMVRIPFGTALTEEVIFRGVLPALATPGWAAAVAASAVFGLWHVQPALNRLRAGHPGAGPAVRLRTAAVAVLLTTLAGLLLVGFRHLTGSLGAPFALHAVVNSSGALLAMAAHRRIRAG